MADISQSGLTRGFRDEIRNTEVFWPVILNQFLSQPLWQLAVVADRIYRGTSTTFSYPEVSDKTFLKQYFITPATFTSRNFIVPFSAWNFLQKIKNVRITKGVRILKYYSTCAGVQKTPVLLSVNQAPFQYIFEWFPVRDNLELSQFILIGEIRFV